MILIKIMTILLDKVNWRNWYNNLGKTIDYPKTDEALSTDDVSTDVAVDSNFTTSDASNNNNDNDDSIEFAIISEPAAKEVDKLKLYFFYKNDLHNILLTSEVL